MILARFIRGFVIGLGMVFFIPGSVLADSPRVVKAKLTETGNGAFRVDVTVVHADKGWKHYADKWEVLGPGDKVIGSRILYHPHVDEQPFTRSLSNLKLPHDVRFVRIRPHDKQHGYGSISEYIPVPGRWTPPKCKPEQAPDWLPKK